MVYRPLPRELQEVAVQRLHEDPSSIDYHIETIRRWASTKPELRIRADDQWLLTFLRGCKYNHDLVKRKLEYLYTRKQRTPEWFSNRDPFLPELQGLLDVGAYVPLPLAHPAAPRVMLTCDCPETLDYDVDAKAKLAFMTLDLMINEDDNSVIIGGHVLGDNSKVTVRHIYQIPPKTAIKGYKIVHQGYALRPRGFHGINIPWYGMVAFNTYKYFAHPELLNIVHLYQNQNLDDLYKVIPPSILPYEYGGDAGSMKALTREWKEKMESYRDWFMEECKEDEEAECFEDAEEGDFDAVIVQSKSSSSLKETESPSYGVTTLEGEFEENRRRENQLDEYTENFLGLGGLIG